MTLLQILRRAYDPRLQLEAEPQPCQIKSYIAGGFVPGATGKSFVAFGDDCLDRFIKWEGKK